VTVQDKEHAYRALLQRLGSLNEQRAVLLDRERRKKEERKKLASHLKSKGIDIDKAEEEMKRLEDELDGHLVEARSLVEKFENELKKLEGGE